MTARANWRDDAACRDADPDLFFPIGTAGPALRQIGAAKRICRTCPAQARCLAWALDNRVIDGVWGGTTGEERHAMRSLPRRMTSSQEDDDGDGHQLAMNLARREPWSQEIQRYDHQGDESRSSAGEACGMPGSGPGSQPAPAKESLAR